MNSFVFRNLASLLFLCLLGLSTRPALAAIETYDGNGNNSFSDEAVGSGTMTVSDDGSGGVDFTFTLGNGMPFSSLATEGATANDLVIYVDNGQGGGIGNTALLTAANLDNGQEAVTENNGSGPSGQSILNFNGLMAPQYAIDFLSGFGGYGQVYAIDSGTSPVFIDGAAPGDNSTNGTGLTYNISGSTATIDIPAVDFGLSSFSGDTLTFAAIEVSETGYSSNEGTVDFSGSPGWGNVQYVESVNTFTLETVPEGSTAGMLACGAAALLLLRRRKWLRRA